MSTRPPTEDSGSESEEVEEPFKTLYEIVEKIGAKNPTAADGIYARIEEIVWDPATFKEVDETYIPRALKPKYQTIQPYIRDARSIGFDVIFNSASPCFGPNVALILANRIWEMPASETKNATIQAFTNRVLQMGSADETDICDTCEVLYQLRMSPNEKVDIDASEFHQSGSESGSESVSEDEAEERPPPRTQRTAPSTQRPPVQRTQPSAQRVPQGAQRAPQAQRPPNAQRTAPPGAQRAPNGQRPPGTTLGAPTGAPKAGAKKTVRPPPSKLSE